MSPDLADNPREDDGQSETPSSDPVYGQSSGSSAAPQQEPGPDRLSGPAAETCGDPATIPSLNQFNDCLAGHSLVLLAAMSGVYYWESVVRCSETQLVS
jgi:hypothetical protein